MADKPEETPSQSATDPAPKADPAKPPTDAAKDVEGEGNLQTKLERALGALKPAQQAAEAAKKETAAERKKREDAEAELQKLREQQPQYADLERRNAILVQERRAERFLIKAGLPVPEDLSGLVGTTDEETDAKLTSALNWARTLQANGKQQTLDANRRVPDDGEASDDWPDPAAFSALPEDRKRAYEQKAEKQGTTLIAIWRQRGKLGPTAAVR